MSLLHPYYLFQPDAPRRPGAIGLHKEACAKRHHVGPSDRAVAMEFRGVNRKR